jgi:hypothetical protein
MGDGSILDVLWRAKITIVITVLLIVTAAIATFIYIEKRGLDGELSGLQSDYGTLNDKYSKLISDYNSLTTDRNSLNQKYSDINDKYNKLSVDKSYLQSSYDTLNGKFTDLNNTVSSFKESGGANIALSYGSYVTQGSDPKKIVDATAYNVGSSRASKVFIKCRIQDGNTTSVKEQEFDNMDPIHKGHVHWEFDDLTLIQSVWTELG